MEKKEIIKFWAISAKNDLETANWLFEGKRYLPCLFFCHLSIEKMLKAIIIKKNAEFQPIHNLVRLANLSKLPVTDEIKNRLSDISEFNIRARYDDYKYQLYKKANKIFTQKYLINTKRIIKWLKTYL